MNVIIGLVIAYILIVIFILMQDFNKVRVYRNIITKPVGVTASEAHFYVINKNGIYSYDIGTGENVKHKKQKDLISCNVNKNNIVCLTKDNVIKTYNKDLKLKETLKISINGKLEWITINDNQIYGYIKTNDPNGNRIVKFNPNYKIIGSWRIEKSVNPEYGVIYDGILCICDKRTIYLYEFPSKSQTVLYHHKNKINIRRVN